MDVPDWLDKINLFQVPDHNTLWRAFGALLQKRRVEQALGLLSSDASVLGKELASKPLTMLLGFAVIVIIAFTAFQSCT